MARLPHRDDEEVTLNLTVTFPKAVLDRVKSMRSYGFTNLPVKTLLAEYAAGCLRDIGKYEWDDQIIQTMTDEQLDEVIDLLQFEREFRAEVAAEDGEESDEPDYLDVEVDAAASRSSLPIAPSQN
jgi:hypothetical protein